MLFRFRDSLRYDCQTLRGRGEWPMLPAHAPFRRDRHVQDNWASSEGHTRQACMGGELRGEDAKSITSTHYIWGLALFQALAVAYGVGVPWP